ncbi:MAG: class I SAM-dependent methyltransferase [Candidatus Sumerlaeota bacterium]|nr:class I SAM-dependent methyltransferase [Candidatus Sumerlaeota bacterium]
MSAPAEPAAREATQYPGVFGRIHRNDTMVPGFSPEALAHYQAVGSEACALVEQALRRTGRALGDVRSLLDFGCGYGRVLRMLAQRMDPAKIAAFEVDPRAPAFCAAEFGVQALGINKAWDWAAVPFGQYDVIWAGSIFTHLNEADFRSTLALLSGRLNPGGLLVFTTHGQEALRRTPTAGGARLAALVPRIWTELDQRGFCFLPYEPDELEHILPFPYPAGRQFGATWVNESYVRAAAHEASMGRLEFLAFQPQAWDNLQDAFTFRRRAA